jgi:ribosomal-protein-alanine N-acetyltransferase
VSAARTRRATMADADELAALDADAFDVAWDAASVRGLLAGALTRAWRLDVGDTLVAALLVRVVAGEGEVLRLAVAQAWRRQGHARAIMRTAMADLAAHLPHGLHLEVRASNSPARRLYASLGFAEVGRRPGYYVAPVEDAVLMRWMPSAEGVAQGQGRW